MATTSANVDNSLSGAVPISPDSFSAAKQRNDNLVYHDGQKDRHDDILQLDHLYRPMALDHLGMFLLGAAPPRLS